MSRMGLKPKPRRGGPTTCSGVARRLSPSRRFTLGWVFPARSQTRFSERASTNRTPAAIITSEAGSGTDCLSG